MPIILDSSADAFDALVERLNSASFAKDVKAKDDDINFLSDFMNDPLVQALVEVCFQLTTCALTVCTFHSRGVAV